MKRTTINHVFRTAGWISLIIIGLTVLYVLSIGPATRWVMSSVSGARSSAVAASTYDRRLEVYGKLYSPFFRLRSWARFHVTDAFEKHFWRYERLFALPCRLADGREVFSTVGSAILSGESTREYIQRAIGTPEPTPKRGTELHSLPRCGRTLVILDSEEDDLIKAVLDAAFEHSLADYALLKIP